MEIPKIDRTVVNPPGAFDKYFVAGPEVSKKLIEDSSLTLGAKDLLQALLTDGTVLKFGDAVGLGYDFVFKQYFDTLSAESSLNEIADKIRGSVDVIIAPEDSAIVPGGQLALLLGVPIVRVNKNRSDTTDCYSVQIPSYTQGKKDVMSVNRIAFEKAAATGGRMFLLDEIIDCGTMTLAIQALITQAANAKIPVKLVGAGALMEKTFTGAKKRIKNELGFDLIGVLKIEDLGLKPQPWVKIEGIEQALTFAS